MRGLGIGLGLVIGAVLRTVLASFTDFGLWGPTDVTLVSNNALDSVGGMNADTITEAATTNVHAISTAQNVELGKVYALEVLLAPGTCSTAYIGIFDGIVHSAFIDLATGAVASPTAVVSVTTSTAGLLNGFQRVTFRWAANSTTAASVGIYMTDAALNVSYLGDISKTMRIHTAQISVG